MASPGATGVTVSWNPRVLASIGRRQRDLFHELGERNVLPALESRFQPHLGESGR